MNYLQLFSIVLESVTVAVFLMVAMVRGRGYGYGFALTFGIYVFYDLAKLLEWNVPASMLNPLFLLATISALLSAWDLYKKV